MNNMIHSLLLILVISLVTVALRFLPFICFPADRPIPKSLSYLGSVLPGAIMGMLVIYCFKSTVVFSYPFALPELIATVLVVILYLWKRNSLLSIGLGTIVYMILVQFVFVRTTL